MPDDEKLYADLWMKLSDQFWKHVSLLPVVQLAVLASWYTMLKDLHLCLALGSLAFGAIVMAVGFALLYRTTEYIRHFRNKIARHLAGVPEPWFKGERLACWCQPCASW
jgi:hypothetical protein